MAAPGSPSGAAATPERPNCNLPNTDTLPPAHQLARDSSLERTSHGAAFPQCAGIDSTDGQRPAGNGKEASGLANLFPRKKIYQKSKKKEICENGKPSEKTRRKAKGPTAVSYGSPAATVSTSTKFKGD